ncbi:uncharacterized protein Z518_10533 [Rhinocladiella mackenziei CBS 650.93]|uniref:Major facilitator superfamily (MFS) profile domain-containing protein n=1 Tax=Rhinocladiella mackenziei CBS 650.93 TaxID=1442369 RepID=A0A0D2I3N3_9EURO|nr:uncharacterized protein Z518_10533 [Rhinocladiella mackenziei CBS 650.93]KIX00394.1 hypothetical protein Z518_10533 [Rhinocladiella mackenziei CBS 650.93]
MEDDRCTSHVLLCSPFAVSGVGLPNPMRANLRRDFSSVLEQELVASLTITDIFFLHQRGKVMGIYNCTLSLGGAFGLVVFGMTLKTQDWRVIYWIAAALAGFCTLVMLFTIPETNYNRVNTVPRAVPIHTAAPPMSGASIDVKVSKPEDEDRLQELEELPSVPQPTTSKRKPYLQRMKILSPAGFTYLARGPLGYLINSVTIGMVVVLSSNFSTAFQTIYGFTAWQAGLTFVSNIIAAILAIFFAGHFSDWVADMLTQRNGGVRIPEMRLPARAVSAVTGPLACILYGVGFGEHLHWICPVIGIGLVAFTIVQSMNVSLVYILDSYHPIAGEVIVTQSTFKACFSFLLSFYTDPWVEKDGYLGAFGAMGGIVGAILLGFIPFFLYGDRLRRASWKWPVIRKMAHWSEDREVGE